MENPELALIDAAEVLDRKDLPPILALKKKSYDFCVSLGLDDDAIRETMGLTSHQLRLLKNFKNA